MAAGTQLEKAPPARPLPPGLAGRLAALWRLVRVRWATLLPAQRRWTLAAGLLLAALLGGLFWYGLRTDWRTLYAGLDPDDARQISQALTQAQIPFEVSPDGSLVRVPLSQLDKARLATAAGGGVKSGRMGFEIFDKPNWVGSEFDEQVNYQRALEGELEHTVASLSDVASARVHLVLPHDSLFREQERPAKASVVLKLRRRTLADGEPEAIRNLVASAVDGLSADRVVLVDSDGREALGPRTAEAERLRAEQALEDKLIATLEPVTGVGNVRASVVLDYDQTSAEETDETYDPDQTVTLSMERSEQTAGPQPVAAGVPGTASNAPNTSASGGLPVYPQQTTPPQSAKTESGTYAATKTTRHVVAGPGRLRRLTAAIVVNDRLATAAAKNRPAVWQPRSADELTHLTALAEASVGFDKSRGDVVAVQDLAFDGNRAEPPAAVSTRWLAAAESSPVLVKYIALLAGVLVVLAFGVRPALKRARGSGLAAPGELPLQAQPALRPPSEPPELDAERQRSQEVLEQVTGHMKREPSQSSRLLQSWIHSE
jgi:flagellar M-ring protein FliF